MCNSGDTCSTKYKGVILGTGSALPEKTLTNDDLSKMVDTNDEWITTRTGIKVRHIASENETTASLATIAAERALEAANISAEQLDAIIVATITPEMVFPSTACFVQASIGAKNAFAFDLSAACSGFVYALTMVEHMMESGKYEHILVIGAETLSKITNYEDRGSCILFGDGAGAAVVKRSENTDRGIMYTTCAADGSGWEALYCQAYGSRYPVSKPLDDPSKIYMTINGREVYQLAVRRIVETIEECLEKCNLKVEDVKICIPHQMNARIIESATKRLDFKDEQIFVNIDKTGNTSAASIPIAFDEWFSSGDAKEGDIVIMVSFGAGLTWGASVIKL